MFCATKSLVFHDYLPLDHNLKLIRGAFLESSLLNNIIFQDAAGTNMAFVDYFNIYCYLLF